MQISIRRLRGISPSESVLFGAYAELAAYYWLSKKARLRELICGMIHRIEVSLNQIHPQVRQQRWCPSQYLRSTVICISDLAFTVLERRRCQVNRERLCDRICSLPCGCRYFRTLSNATSTSLALLDFCTQRPFRHAAWRKKKQVRFR